MFTKQMLQVLAVVAVGMVCWAGAAQAAVIQPVAAAASTPNWGIAGSYNGVGFADNPVTLTSTIGTTHDGKCLIKNSSETFGWIALDLGDPGGGQWYNITGFHLWNMNTDGERDRGAKVTNVYVQASMPASGPLPSLGTLVGSYTFPQASGSSTYAGADYTFTAPQDARYVLFNVSNTYGSYGVAITEVRFVGTVVPEPATVALLGLGGIGLILRRKRR